MAEKMLRVAGRSDDGFAKAFRTDKDGNLGVQLKDGISRSVSHKNYTSASIMHGFGETIYSGGNAANSRTSFKPFKCGDLEAVILKIQNNSDSDMIYVPQILLFNTELSGSEPEFVYELPRLKSKETVMIRISDNILDLAGVLVSLPKLSALGVGYRQATGAGINVSVSMWGAGK